MDVKVARRHIQGATWTVREECSERLLVDSSPNWFALEGDPRAELVKKGRRRSTWRVRLGERWVYAKVFDPPPSAPRRILRTFRDAADQEAAMSFWAQKHGVPVAPGLAAGVSQGPSHRSVFLSLGVEGAVRLTEAWERCKDRGSHIGLIDAVAGLFSAAHERGFLHGDGHPNNILVRQPAPDVSHALFMDLHFSSRSRRPVPLTASLWSVAELDQYFQRRAGRAQRLRFLKEYFLRRPTLAEHWRTRRSKRAMLGLLFTLKDEHSYALARGRDRRISGHNKFFGRMRLSGRWQAVAVLQLERRHVFPEPDVANRTRREWRQVLNPLVREFGRIDAARACFDYDGFQVEFCRVQGWLAKFEAWIRGSGQRRIFRQCHRHRHRDIASPLILAYLEHRHGGFVDATMLVRPLPTNGTATGMTGPDSV